MEFNYDVLIIGGGPAGLSAALTLGRLNRTALVCDDGRPRNAPSSHVNNFPSQDGIHPQEWRRRARQDLEKYKTIHTSESRVLSLKRLKAGFQAELSTGSSVLVKKIILAYGVIDRLPAIDGFKELWGRGIFHCPFCHGFEIRGSALGFLISNEMSFHPLPMIHSLASHLVVMTNDKLVLSEEKKLYLAEKKIGLIEKPIEKIIHNESKMSAIQFKDGSQLRRDYLFYGAELPLTLKSTLGTELGCARNQLGLYEVNEMNETSILGVYAGGDNMSQAHSVLFSSAAGAKAAVGVIAALLHE